MNRVVVTGIGAISPIGNSVHETWSGARKGESGVAPITGIQVMDLPWKVAGMVKNFHAEEYLSPKEIKRLDPFVQYAVAAAVMATEDADLTGRECLKMAGVIIGSSRGGISTLEKALRVEHLSCSMRTSSRVSAYLMPSTTISMAASFVAQKIGISGYCLGISNACASGLNAIGEAYRLIKGGYPHPVLCGGAEAPVCRICIEGYGVTGALSARNDPSASRPFDKTRNGFVLAEGACVHVLETYEHAKERGARIYGEIMGYGNTTDSYHQTIPSAEGEARAMKLALDEAGLQAGDIDFISAHGTSTRLGDKTETEAIKRVFGRNAYSIPVTALKSLTGHMLAASGALEAGLTLLSLKEGVITPTAHLHERDPECDLDYVTELRRVQIEHTMSQSFGFGGLNAVVIFGAVNP